VRNLEIKRSERIIAISNKKERKKERIGVLVFPTEIGRSAALHSLKLVFGN